MSSHRWHVSYLRSGSPTAVEHSTQNETEARALFATAGQWVGRGEACWAQLRQDGELVESRGYRPAEPGERQPLDFTTPSGCMTPDRGAR